MTYYPKHIPAGIVKTGKTLLIDGDTHTFEGGFKIASATEGKQTYPIPAAKSLLSFSLRIIDDNLGPIFIVVELEAGGKYHHLDAQDVLDGSGYNQKQFSWTGRKPMALRENNINIYYTNYCGNAVNVEFIGIVE